MIPDDFVGKPYKARRSASVGRGERQTDKLRIVGGQRIVRRAFFVKAVCCAEVLKSGDGKFFINFQVGSAIFTVDRCDAACSADGMIRIKEEILE